MRVAARLRERVVHELSVCGALIDQVAALAATRGAQCVRRITIEIGPLSGVDPGLFRAAFAVLRSGSCAAAVLTIDTLDVRIRCNTCDAVSATAPNRLVCVHCGSFRSRVVQGDELLLRRVEMDAGSVARVVAQVGAADRTSAAPARTGGTPPARGRRH